MLGKYSKTGDSVIRKKCELFLSFDFWSSYIIYCIYSRIIDLIREDKRGNDTSALIITFLKYVLFLYAIKEIVSKINLQEKILFNNLEISLKIKGTGLKNVLNCEGIGFEYPSPSSINLGASKQSFDNCRQINISLPEITVSLIWNVPLYSMYVAYFVIVLI